MGERSHSRRPRHRHKVHIDIYVVWVLRRVLRVGIGDHDMVIALRQTGCGVEDLLEFVRRGEAGEVRWRGVVDGDAVDALAGQRLGSGEEVMRCLKQTDTHG
jgi:hypothetical protein